MVGLATINQYIFHLLGIDFIWYQITDWLGFVAILVAFGFTALGFFQLIRRKSIRKVDCQILVLGLFYLLLFSFYVFFERVVVNYRPVILGEGLEASYPSSHTMLVVCIMVTAAMQFHEFWPHKKKLCRIVDVFSGILIGFTVVGRLISGVHWFTDIVGALLLSGALIALYDAVKWCPIMDRKIQEWKKP